MTNFSLIMTDIFLDQNDTDQSIRFKKMKKVKKPLAIIGRIC